MAKRISRIEGMSKLSASNHRITLANARKMAGKYQKFRKNLAAARANNEKVPADTPEQAICYSFNKESILQLLKPDAAVGLRIYPGITHDNRENMVLVAFDADGNNITSEHPSASVLLKAGKKSSLNLITEDPNDGVLDDGMSNPPYSAPDKP